VLQDDADALPVPSVGPPGVGTEHADLAAVPAAVPLEDLHGRGLPRAVRPEQAEDLAHLHVEVDAAHGLDLAVGLPQAADADRDSCAAWFSGLEERLRQS
jgi:hypothetical protein